jgi:ACS family tartrate transporter-like MFS transporter
MGEVIEKQVMRRIYWRLVPVLFAMMFFNYIDRINVAYASLQMNDDLYLSATTFGFGAGVFFLGYMLFEIPSNLILYRVGARVWLARIIITWGALSAGMALISGPISFYILRFGLGVAEAGFLPGVVLYVTYWFPPRYRARAIGGFIVAGAFAGVLGPPVSTALMAGFDGLLGQAGWRWMFVAEGVPTILLGLFTLWYLTDQPKNAKWLSDAERAWLARELSVDDETDAPGLRAVMQAVRNPTALVLGCLFGCALVGVYGLLLWLPQIVRSMGNLSNIQVGGLSALPPLLGIAGTLLVSYTSDRSGDRKVHLVVIYAVAGVTMLASAMVVEPIWSYGLICVSAIALSAGNPLVWSLNASLATGITGAASIALVNTIAQSGGLVGPWLIGLMKDATGDFSGALIMVAGFVFVASLLAASLNVGATGRPVRSRGAVAVGTAG